MSTELHHLAAAYALDALDADERADFEAHLADCADCAADLASFGSVAANLAEATAETPPAHLKDAVMARVAATAQDSPVESGAPAATTISRPSDNVAELGEHRRRKFSMGNLLMAAAAVVMLVVGAVVISGLRGGSDLDDVLAAPDAVVTQLQGESGSVRVVWSAERDQVAVFASDIDDLAPGLIYELWAIADGVAIPAGLFDASNGVIRDVADIDDIDAEAFGITIEPAGGSLVATSDIIYFGET